MSWSNSQSLAASWITAAGRVPTDDVAGFEQVVQQGAGLDATIERQSCDGHRLSLLRVRSAMAAKRYRTVTARGATVGVASLALQGAFERFPDLKVIMIEGGFGWLASLMWRLDRHWARHREEVPHVTRPPSESLRQGLWISTQPMEEPERVRQLLDVIDWIGHERLLIATDYPHGDFDDPSQALPRSLPQDQRRAICSGNARHVYRL